MTTHLLWLRGMLAVGLATLPAIYALGLRLEPRSGGLPPHVITVLAAVAGLWLAFTAERDARARLDRAKRAYAATGDEQRLLRDHRLVYAAVLLRLEAIAGCGLIAAVWGNGPLTSLWFLAVAAAMMLLTWPTRAKTELLLRRARALRPE